MRTRLAALAAVVLATTALTGIARAAGTAPKVRDGILAVDGQDAHQTTQIYTVHTDGSNVRQLTHEPQGSFAENPAWSPDGTLIAYDATTGSTNYNAGIHVMDADGTHKRLVFDSPDTFDSQASWLPGGTRLVFDRCNFSDPEGCGLYSINLDGTGLKQITPRGAGHFDFSAAVSHDGAHVLFNRNEQGGYTARIWMVNIDGTHAHPVTAGALTGNVASWAPDDKSFIFGDNCCKLNANLYTERVGSTQARALTHLKYPKGVYVARWSPTGTRIALSIYQPTGGELHSHLFVMKGDGSGLRRITTSITDPFTISWAPAVAS